MKRLMNLFYTLAVFAIAGVSIWYAIGYHRANNRVNEATALMKKGDPASTQQAISLLKQAVANLGANEQVNIAICNYDLGLCYHDLKQYPEAIAAFEKAMPDLETQLTKQTDAEKLQAKKDKANAFEVLGECYSEIKAYDKAIQAFQDAQPLFAGVNDTQGEALARNNEAGMHYNNGLAFVKANDSKRALLEFQSAQSLYEQTGKRDSEAECLKFIGAIYSDAGDTQKAEEAAKREMTLHTGGAHK